MCPRSWIKLLVLRMAGRRHLKLHLGCGGDYQVGFVNIDSDPAATADLHVDFCSLAKLFAPESVAEVVMTHSLAYLNLSQARDLFRQLMVVLEPAGRLIVETPDVMKCSRKILESAQRVPDYMEGVRGLYAFDLDQLAHGKAYPPYAFGWSGWHLKQELESAGFRDVALQDPQTHADTETGKPRVWRDVRVEAGKP